LKVTRLHVFRCRETVLLRTLIVGLANPIPGSLGQRLELL